MECKINDHNCIVSCDDKLTLETLSTQKEVFSQALCAKKNIIFAVNDLNVVDSAALQLFLIFTTALKAQHIDWQWQSPTAAFIKTTELLGMKELLKINAEVKQHAD